MMRRQRGFTLLEMVLAITVFSILIGVVFTAYSRMIQLKVNVEARQTLIDRSYYMMEKLQVMMADYTIDYEEYYNRKIVGCDESGVSGTGGDNGNCDIFTSYGNGSPNGNSAPKSCSSSGAADYDMDACLGGRSSESQGYGSYAYSFVDVGDDVDTVAGARGDEDDVDLGSGPAALVGPVPELYLISHDETKRLYLRRALLGSGDRNGDGDITPTEKLYSIQQLQLQGVDAGYTHNFEGDGAYDGVVDTRWCDAELGYVCEGALPEGDTTMLNKYRDAGYRFASDVDDGWVDVFGDEITVTSWHLQVSPDTDPDLARAMDDKQISPYVTISMTTQLYAEHRANKIGDTPLEAFSMPLQTTFAMKEFYR